MKRKFSDYEEGRKTRPSVEFGRHRLNFPEVNDNGFVRIPHLEWISVSAPMLQEDRLLCFTFLIFKIW
jgi:hypothetical protein